MIESDHDRSAQERSRPTRDRGRGLLPLPLLVLTLLVLVLASPFEAHAQPLASPSLPPGVIDLEPLWRVHSGDLAECDRAEDGPSWMSQDEFLALGRSAPPTVCLRARLALGPDQGAPVGVALGHFLGAWSVHANGVELARGGDLATGRGSLYFQETAFLVPAAASRDTGELTIDVRVHLAPDLYWGGGRFPLEGHGHLAGPMSLVDSLRRAEVSRDSARQLTASLVEALTFILLAVFQLVLFSKRRELTEYLYMALAHLSFAGWLLSSQLTTFGVSLDIESWFKALSSLQLAFTIAGIWRLFHKGPMPWSARGLVILVLIAPTGRVLAPELFFGLFPYSMHMLILLLGLVWIVRWVVIAAVGGNSEGRTLLVGILGFAACFGAQVGSAVLGLPMHGIGLLLSYGANVGMIFYAVAVTIALANRFTGSLAELDATYAAAARFVPMDFIRLLGKDSIREVGLGNQVGLTMSILFSDLRGFSRLAEELGPVGTFSLINEYLHVMEPEIHRHHGFIRQYLGDGIMALFPGTPDDAVQAAIAMHSALARFNEARSVAGLPPLRMGMGINTGEVMLGTIGGQDRLDSGVVGSAVNLASRIEGMTKMYGAALLVSDRTVDAMTDRRRFSLREIDRVVAKGTTDPVGIFEVLDVLPEATRSVRQATTDLYAAALDDLQRGDFASARDRFAALEPGAPDDEAIALMARRAAELAAAPPAAWSGTTALLTK